MLTYSTTAYKHEMHLHKVFTGLRKKKLQAKLKKCEFGKLHMQYFGHIVGSGELRVDMDEVAAVHDWAAPVDIKVVY